MLSPAFYSDNEGVMYKMGTTAEMFNPKLEAMALERKKRYLNKKLQEQIRYAYKYAPSVKGKFGCWAKTLQYLFYFGIIFSGD